MPNIVWVRFKRNFFDGRSFFEAGLQKLDPSYPRNKLPSDAEVFEEKPDDEPGGALPPGAEPDPTEGAKTLSEIGAKTKGKVNV